MHFKQLLCPMISLLFTSKGVTKTVMVSDDFRGRRRNSRAPSFLIIYSNEDHETKCCPPWGHAPPRAYPSGLGISLEKVHLDELHRPAHGDLRVVNQPNPGLSDKEIFQTMNMGDVWLEADLLPCFRYLYFCRHTRTQPFKESIPHAWCTNQIQ